jgi:uncharacterized membrane protein
VCNLIFGIFIGLPILIGSFILHEKIIEKNVDEPEHYKYQQDTLWWDMPLMIVIMAVTFVIIWTMAIALC